MTKLIIVEGSDRLGKGSLIKRLCEYYDYKNVTIRHCDKPPKNLSQKEVLNFQFKCFNQEKALIYDIINMNNKFSYHDNIIIYDRFYLGEYVYSQMFREGDPEILKEKLIKFEEDFLSYDVTLITLTADPEFALDKEDGQSFSQNLEEKTKEIKLFEEAHDFSLIKSKLWLRVDDNEGNFRSKKEIFNDIINFIEK
jgi:thymidylate kinase